MNDARDQQIAILPLAGAFTHTAHLPGSKSLTNRALLLAALADGTSHLSGVLFSDDTRVMIQALRDLGFDLQVDEENAMVIVKGRGGTIPAKSAKLFLGNAGTAYRFLTAACCLGEGVYELDGIPRMQQRPIGQLVDALREMGATIEYLGEDAYPPLRITANGLRGGALTMQPTVSSQYISALLQVGPYCADGLKIQFDGPITSKSYVDMTMDLMQEFRVTTSDIGSGMSVRIKRGGYAFADYYIEADASNASYFFAAAAITPGSKCIIQGLGSESIQGDANFARVLEEMGAEVELNEQDTLVTGPEKLHGIEVDLNDMPDMALTLAVVALFAEGPTTIRNVGNLRIKETDRLAALQTELTKLGATVTINGDDIKIQPPKDNKITPATIDTYDDHRMAMSFAIVGLRAAGIVINDPACVNKTYPNFFTDLDKLRKASAAYPAAGGGQP